MRITEIIAEATDHIGVNKVAEGHLEDPNNGEGDNKTITGANARITVDNLTPPMESITITIIIVIIEAEMDMTVVVIITEVTAKDKAVIKAITITNQYHQYYTHDDGTQIEQYGPPCSLCGDFNHSPKHCFKGEHDVNNLMEKMSLGLSNQHQKGLYQ